MRKLLTGLMAACLPLLASTSSFAEKPSDYASGIPLEVTGDAAFHRVELPFAVHAQARPDLADLRVFNAGGEAVPYALGAWRSTDPAAVKPVLAGIPFFPVRGERAAAGGNLDIKIEQDTTGKVIAVASTAPRASRAPVIACLLDLSAIRLPVQALVFDWSPVADGVSATIRIEYSDDLQSWQLLDEGVLLDMHFGGQLLLQKRIAFAAGKYRYLRAATYGSGIMPPFVHVQAETLPATSAAMPVLRWQAVTATAGDKAGEYLFSPGATLDIARLQLQLPQGNTVAPVELLVRERARDPWRHVVDTTAYRVTQNGQEISSPPLDIPPTRGRDWLLRVDPRAGGMGKDMPVLKLAWEPQQLVFLARGEKPFMLAYGRQDAEPAQLPLSSLLPGYKSGAETSLPTARLLTPVALGGHNAPLPGHEYRPAPDWKRWLLWGVLLVGVALLAWMARGVQRQMNPPA